MGSSGIIASAYGDVFSWGAPPEGYEGAVLSPDANVSCSYTLDGATTGKTCNTPGSTLSTCVAGCGHPPNWCTQQKKVRHVHEAIWCTWRPINLMQMLEWHRRIFLSKARRGRKKSLHNEVIVPSTDFDSQRPPVEAVFFTGVPTNLSFSLLSRLAVAAPGRHVPPLLHLNLTNRQSPFRWFKQSRISPNRQ